MDDVPFEAADPSPSPCAAPRSDRLRLGPLCLPAAAVAWGVSIAAHGALLAVGWVALRSARDGTPQIMLARGDGGDGTGPFFITGASASGSRVELPQAPELAVRAPVAEPPTQQALAEVSPPSWEADPAAPVVLADAADVGFEPIGVPSSEPTVALRSPRGAGGSGSSDAAPVANHQTGGAGIASGAGSGSGTGTGEDAGPGSASGGGGTPGVPDGIDNLSLPAPVYPRESRLRGEQGTVVIEVVVDADGTPAFRVLDDAGYPRLAQAALAAMKKSAFRATGAPYRLTKPFRFTLRRTH